MYCLLEDAPHRRGNPANTGKCLGLPPEPFVCAFSAKVAAATDNGKHLHYLGKELEDGTFELQALNKKSVPSGPKKIMTKEELLEGYMPEPEMYLKTVRPKVRELVKAVAWGDKYREQGKHYSAEMEYNRALAMDSEHVRAIFGLGLCLFQREDAEGAHEVFRKLVDLEAAFDCEHKHLFNEFGIGLRKSKMYPQAIEYYQKALELADPDDENLHFNLARAATHAGQNDLAGNHLQRCMELCPAHTKAKKLLEAIKTQDLRDPEYEPAQEVSCRARQSGAELMPSS